MNEHKRPQILLCDDEPDVTELLKYSLESKGFSVQAFNKPIEFVSRVRDLTPDLIILDVMMPDLDGMQLCQIIRSDPRIKSTPIIFLSAKSEVEDRVKGLEHGADDYLTKPFSTEATEFRLLKLLMERKGRVQSREHLLVSVWNYDTDIETRTVDTHIRRLREKLGPYAHLIETVRGVGYRAVSI